MSKRLFHNLWVGMKSAFDLFPESQRNRFQFHRQPGTDSDRIRGDWEAVGDDLRQSCQDFDQVLYEHGEDRKRR